MSMSTLWLPPLLFSTLFLILSAQNAVAEKRHFCSGTASLKAVPHGSDRYEDLRVLYQNCTRIFGNVEITHLNATVLKGRTLDFLDDIEEVEGYIFIYYTDLTSISFKNLKIIWGDNLIDDTAALDVEMNHHLSVISMPNLRTIVKGTVVSVNSPRLCHLRETVNPDEILNFDRSRLKLDRSGDRLCASKNPTCHPSCNGACWGPSAEDCQTVYRSICPKDCQTKQCFRDAETNQARCCHEQCLAGCTGPTANDCVGCANFKQCKDDRFEPGQECTCVEQCTSRRMFNNETNQMELNPDGYFPVEGRFCEKECPMKFLTQGDECVKECRPGMFYDPNKGDRICRECEGVCPKSCKLNGTLTSDNIKQLENCTEIQGHIRINAVTFSDQTLVATTEEDPHRTALIRGLTEKDLDVLKTVRVISEYVYVAAVYAPLKSLSFLENLEFIEGRSLYGAQDRFALVVSMNDNLESLGLRNLKRISRGDVVITKNVELCHADSYNWKELIANPIFTAKVADNKQDCSQIPSS